MNLATIRLLILALSWLGLSWQNVLAQTDPRSVPESARSLQTRGLRDASREEPNRTSGRWTLEAPLDASTYRVVPGDQVLLGIWNQYPESHSIGISPEGYLVLPQIGPMTVIGLTLEQAESAIREKLAPYYPGAKVSLTLLEPGRFRAFASGFVARPGAYEAQSGDRLHELIEAAGGIRPGGSLRHVRVRSVQAVGVGAASDESTEGIELDYLRWLLAGNLDSNPMLQPGAIVEVPPRGPEVIVRGAVNGREEVPPEASREEAAGNRPAEEPEYPIEWRDGDTVGLAVEAAGGLSTQASSMALLDRAGITNRINLSDPAALSLSVEAGDILDIEYVPRWVYVVGSIRNPGRYPYYPGWSAEEYVMLAGGETETGRRSGWKIDRLNGETREVDGHVWIEPGTTLRVPETRTQKVSRYLAPLSSATALILSIIAVSGR